MLAAAADETLDSLAFDSSLELVQKCCFEPPDALGDVLMDTMGDNFCELVLDWDEMTKQTEWIVPDEPLAVTDDDGASEKSDARSPEARKRSRSSSRSRSAKASSPSLGLTGVVLRRNARANAMSTYMRRKTEMEELSSEAQKLQAMLRELQQTSQTLNDTPTELELNSRWKTLAKRQRQLRAEAERENENLRIAISDHTQMARSLDQVLRRRVEKATDLSVSILRPPRWAESESSLEERVIYGSLLMEVCAMHTDMDRIAQKIVHETASSGSFPRLKAFGFESLHSNEVPFSRSAVNHAIRVFSGERNDHMRRYAVMTFGVMDDTILNKVQSSYSTAAYGSGQVCFRSVTHNVVDAKRSMLFTTKWIDNVTFAGHHIDGLVIKERKWIILEDAGTADCDVTRIQTFAIVEPGGSSPDLSHWSTESLEKVLIPAWNQSQVVIQRRIENILIDESIA
ncbi:hypothetical protein FI667_g16558, partial [Globisporangium splendens]